VLAEALKKAFDASDAERTKDILGQLKGAPITLDILKKTGIGKTMGAVRKNPPGGSADIACLAKELGTLRCVCACVRACMCVCVRECVESVRPREAYGWLLDGSMDLPQFAVAVEGSSEAQMATCGWWVWVCVWGRGGGWDDPERGTCTRTSSLLTRPPPPHPLPPQP
jgi:hypothetical protein